jgi:hypothetical protein
MELASVLSDKKEEIIEEWFDLAVEVYPQDTAKFLKRKADRFANPVGYNFSVAMEAVLDHLGGVKEPEEVVSSLEGLIKVKAVQDFSASQAVRFIFLLKKIIRKHTGDSFEELLELEDKIDRMALVCFDLYMRSRDKIQELKTSELRGMHYRLLEQANLVSRVEEDPIGGNGS